MDGTPARLAMLVSMIRVNRLLGAYSSSQIAVPTPSGNDRSAVRPSAQTDPISAGLMPERAANRDGYPLRNASESFPLPSLQMSISSAARNRMQTTVAEKHTTANS